MTVEELGRGDEEEPRSRSWGWGLVVAAAVLVALAAALHTGTKDPPRRSATPAPSPGVLASAGPTVTPEPDPSLPPYHEISQFVRVGAACLTQTTPTGRLIVAFELVNRTAIPITLLPLTPDVPLDGLGDPTASIRTGQCVALTGPVDSPTTYQLAPGGRAVLSLSYTEPPPCPSAQLRLTDFSVTFAGANASQSSGQADLGAVWLNTCLRPV